MADDIGEMLSKHNDSRRAERAAPSSKGSSKRLTHMKASKSDLKKEAAGPQK